MSRTNYRAENMSACNISTPHKKKKRGKWNEEEGFPSILRLSSFGFNARSYLEHFCRVNLPLKCWRPICPLASVIACALTSCACALPRFRDDLSVLGSWQWTGFTGPCSPHLGNPFGNCAAEIKAGNAQESYPPKVFSAPRLWNSLPLCLRASTGLSSFMRELKTSLFRQ